MNKPIRLCLCITLSLAALPVSALGQQLVPPSVEAKEVVSGFSAEPGSVKTEGFLLTVWYSKSADAYFGTSKIGVAEYVAFNGLASQAKSVSASVLAFRIFNNFQLSLHAAITAKPDLAAEGEAGAEIEGTDTQLESFIQTGGNASLIGDLPLGIYVAKTDAKTGGIQNMASLSFLPILNLDLAPLGSSSENGIRNLQTGLRLFAQKTAVDNANLAVFADVWAGGLFAEGNFFDTIGLPGRKMSWYGKATAGLVLAKTVRLTVTKVFMGPEKMRTPWVVSVALQPGSPM